MKPKTIAATTSLTLAVCALAASVGASVPGPTVPDLGGHDLIIKAYAAGKKYGSERGNGPDAAMNPCGRMSRLARKARQVEARDDFYIALGLCVNMEDPDEQEECVEEAFEELEEAFEEAEEQYWARLDLCALLGGDVYAPEIDPDNFTSVIDNEYLPYVPGTTLVYLKETDEETELIEVTALDETIEIMGVECLVVRDVVWLIEDDPDDPEKVEDTRDYFAQDADGNVWYFGEISLNFEDGELVDVEGSWRAGEDGAQPGIVMPADPMVGQTYRQEFALGDAEDAGTVLSLNESVSVEYGDFDNCLQTSDYTPIEPGEEEYKFYAKGIGLVMEEDPESGEILELIAIEN